MYKVMYSGTLIDDLFAAVERVQNSAAARQIKPTEAYTAASRTANLSKPEQFPQSLRLSPAHGYLGLLLVVHAQLVGTLEPGNHFANAVDIHQVGTVRAPEKICV